MSKTGREPSDVLTDFLNYIDCCRARYQAAQDAVKKEEKRLQDLLHELEFAENENASAGQPRSCSRAGGSGDSRRMR